MKRQKAVIFVEKGLTINTLTIKKFFFVIIQVNIEALHVEYVI